MENRKTSHVKLAVYIISLQSALSQAIFSSIPNKFILNSITLFQICFSLPLPLTISSVCHSLSLITNTSFGFRLTWLNHHNRFSIILFSLGVTPTFFLITSFQKQSFLVWRHIQRNIRIFVAFIL